jgi:Ca2+-binding RTX toxin-like protein
VLSGLGGNDSIIGGGGADQLDGGLGDDWLYVDSADTLIQGSLGFDRMIVQGSGAVVIDLAAAGIEAAYGSTGGDTLNGASTSVALFLDGGAGNDQLTGGSAVDVLVGGAGADALNGGGGDDWLYTDAADTSIIGGTGFDRVFLTDTAGQAITLVGSGVELVWGNTGNDYIDLTNNGIVIGGPSYIIGDFGNDVIYGSQGIDVVISGFGVDAVFGNGGDDWLYVEAEDSLIVGGDGFDRGFVSGLTGVSNWDLSGSGLEVFFASDGGNDIVHNIGASVGMYILGQAGNDVISGGAGDDFFYGGLGADTIRGGAGNDNLWGGNEGASTPGDAGDRFEFVGNWGADRVWDWQDGSDVLAFSLAGVTNANQLGYAYDALNNVSTFWYGANVLTVNGLADRADVVIF